MIDRRLFTNALLAMLNASTDKVVGDHTAPPAANGDEYPPTPYGVLYGISGGQIDGPPFDDPHADIDAVYQVTSVGRTREQAEWMRDKVREVLLARNGRTYIVPIVVEGMGIMGRDIVAQGGIVPEGKLFNAVDQFVFALTPST